MAVTRLGDSEPVTGYQQADTRSAHRKGSAGRGESGSNKSSFETPHTLQ